MLLRGASTWTQEMDEADIAQRCINSENEITWMKVFKERRI